MLLDRDHNAQPSKKNNYKLTRNIAENSEFEKLILALSQKTQSCHLRQCPHCTRWDELIKSQVPHYEGKSTLAIGLSQEILSKFFRICKADCGITLDAIIELGLDVCCKH